MVLVIGLAHFLLVVNEPAWLVIRYVVVILTDIGQYAQQVLACTGRGLGESAIIDRL